MVSFLEDSTHTNYITRNGLHWQHGTPDTALQPQSLLSQLLVTPSRLGEHARLVFLVGLLVFFLAATRLLHHHYRRTGAMSRLLLIVLSACLLGLLSLARSQPPTTAHPPSDSVFTLPPDADVGQNVIANVNDPQAVDPQSVCPGYIASNVVKTANGITADLSLAGAACNLYGTDIAALTLVVDHQDADRLHVGIQPKFVGQSNHTWFVLPEELIPRPPPATEPLGPGGDLDFGWGNQPSFYFNVTRRSTGDVLFSTKDSRLVYADQFIEFSSSLPENYNLYGLGEVIHGLRLGNNLTRTLFNADVGDIIDANIYGHHPIYYDTRYFEVDGTSGKRTYAPNATDRSARYTSYTHGVFNRNAHAQEILLRESNITWRALGGTVDLYFYDGPSQAAITKSYQKSAVGLPAMQQLWAFGFHQCRWGYRNWSEVENVVSNFEKFGIPLETIWTDIDYMNQYRNFDNDGVRFGYEDGARFLSRLHAKKQHYVPIIDSAIYVPNPENASDAYITYNRGVAEDAFMLNPDGSLYIGAVWPGYTVYPDWVGALLNGTGANRWWTSEVSAYHDKVNFDGIWIDMSEVSSFCVGSCGSSNLTLNPAHPSFSLPGEPGNEVLDYPEGFNVTNATEAASISAAHPASTEEPSSAPESTSYYRTTPTPGVRNVNWPPYAINNHAGDIAVHAVSPNATHHGGTLEYDFHNVFGHQILNATYHALLDVFPSRRPFIIGRSQFAGSGKWAGHWGGDNYSLWAYLYFSIPQALSYSLFGIPMFGVDTCGFGGNTDMELCSRWMQLSAFFPFYRNHNSIGSISQEPYVWSEVIEASKAAMRIRYALLPYIYTTFYLSHSTGSTTMRALAWDFPDEPWLADADRQFLLGNAIMVTPCLEQGATTVGGVFPGSGDGTVWYDWYNKTAISGVGAGQNVTIDAPLGHIPVYVRGGSVLPMQEPGMTTAETRNSPWSVLVALDAQGHATGSLYLDDGESLYPNATTWVDFTASADGFTATPSGNFTDCNSLGNVTIMGLAQPVLQVTLNGAGVGPESWSFDKASHVLRITKLDSLTKDGAWGKEWTLGWN